MTRKIRKHNTAIEGRDGKGGLKAEATGLRAEMKAMDKRLKALTTRVNQIDVQKE